MKWQFDRKYMKASGYVILTAFIIMFLNKIMNNIPQIAGTIWDKIMWVLTVLSPVVWGFAIAYLFNPIVNLFEKWMKGRRGLAVAATMLLVILVLTAMVSALVFSVTDQLKVANFNDMSMILQSFVDSLNAFYQKLLVELDNLNIQSDQITEYVQNASQHVVTAITGFLNGILSSVNNASGIITNAIFSLIIGIYFMLDGRVVVGMLDRVATACFREKTNLRIRELLGDLDHAFSGYLKGQGMDVIVMMILIGTSLSIVGVKFSILIGFFAGLFNLIPYCGPIVAYGLTAIVCLVNGEIKKMVIAIIVLLVIQTIDGNIIGPKLLSQSIDIHPLLVIIALIVAGSIGGFLGMLLAVPVAGFLKVEFDKWIVKKEKKRGIVHTPPAGNADTEEPAKSEPN